MGKYEEAGELNVRLRLSGAGDRSEGGEDSSGLRDPQAASVFCAAPIVRVFQFVFTLGKTAKVEFLKLSRKAR